MVDDQLRPAITDARVLAAMAAVPRHRFVPPELTDAAYADEPLPIGRGQTISQPFVVAAMTELAHVGPGARVLEIGTGSGYQAAVLLALGAEVWSIERDPALAALAADRLAGADGAERLHLRVGDGSGGWPEAAPFTAIVVTAAPPVEPPALRAQLAIGGRLVLPIGESRQTLWVIARSGADRFVERPVFAVRFVPLISDPAA